MLFIIHLQNISAVINIRVFRLLGMQNIYVNTPCSCSCCEKRRNHKAGKKFPSDDFSLNVSHNCPISLSSLLHCHLRMPYTDLVVCSTDSHGTLFLLFRLDIIAWFPLIPELPLLFSNTSL